MDLGFRVLCHGQRVMRWRILALLFFARIGMGFQFQTLASVGDRLVTAFDLDYAEIGVLIGLFMAPGLVLALPAGYLGRFVSDRMMVTLGLLALALGGVVSAVATESWVIGAGRVLAGIGFLFPTLYFTKMVADWFEGREIATAMSFLVMSWPFGIAMGQVGHAWLVQVFGWQVPFLVASVYCMFGALGIFVFYRAPEGLACVNQGDVVRLSKREWRLIVCAGLAWGAFNAGYVTYLSIAPKVLESLGHTALAAAGLISVGSWLMIVSGAVCGMISDRFGRRNLILAVCMAGAIVSLLLLNIRGAGLAASVLFGVLGLAPAGLIMALAGKAVRPQNRAFGMGVFFTIYFIFMLIMPPVAGAILDATGRANAPLVLAMGAFALVVPLALWFQRIQARPCGR